MPSSRSTSSPGDDHRYREERLDLPGRPSDAPKLLQAFNHPLVPNREGRIQRILIWFMDTTYEGMKALYKKEKVLDIPYKKSYDDLANQGFWELLPGDYVFAACMRLNADRRRPELDVPKFWCTGEDDITPAQKAALEQAQQDILGPRELRGLKEVVYDESSDTYLGAAEVERSPRNPDEKRSHTYGPTLQKQTCIIAPPSSAKLATADTKLDDNLVSRKNLLKAAADISTSTLLMGPPSTVSILEKQNDLVNTLKFGSHQTKSFTTFQLNLAGAETQAGALEQLGRAGVKHFDRNDHIGSFTDTLACSDIPDDFNPGVMFVLAPMMFMKLVKYRGVKFSGLHMHGGTPPTAPSIDTTLSGWETRAVCVSYRTTIAAEGKARYPLCAASNKREAIYSTPEMRYPEDYGNIQGKINRATYARDGISLTDDKGLMDFYTRELYCLAQYALRGLPDHLKVQFDCDAFMKAISFKDGDKRRTATPWVYPPGWRPFNASREPNQTGVEVSELENQIPLRLQARQEGKEHDVMLGQFLPHVVAHDKVPALSDDDVKRIIQRHEPTTSGDMTKFSYTKRVKEDPSLPESVRGGYSVEQDAETEPSDEEDDVEKSEDVVPSNPAFDVLVDKEGNSRAAINHASKKSSDAVRRAEAKEKQKTSGREKKKIKKKPKRGPGVGNIKVKQPLKNKGSGNITMPLSRPLHSEHESGDQSSPPQDPNTVLPTDTPIPRILRPRKPELAALLTDEVEDINPTDGRSDSEYHSSPLLPNTVLSTDMPVSQRLRSRKPEEALAAALPTDEDITLSDSPLPPESEDSSTALLSAVTLELDEGSNMSDMVSLETRASMDRAIQKNKSRERQARNDSSSDSDVIQPSPRRKYPKMLLDCVLVPDNPHITSTNINQTTQSPVPSDTDSADEQMVLDTVLVPDHTDRIIDQQAIKSSIPSCAEHEDEVVRRREVPITNMSPRPNKSYVLLPPLSVVKGKEGYQTTWQDFAFLNKFSLTNIVSDMRRLECAFVNVQEVDEEESVLSLRELDQKAAYVTTLLAESEGVLEHISVIARNLQQLQKGEAFAAIEVKTTRMSIMLSYMTISNWLDQTVTFCRHLYESPQEVYLKSTDPVYWLWSLLRKARRMVQWRQPDQIFYPKDFGVTIISGEKGYVVKKQSSYVDDEDALRRTLGIVEDVLCGWTGVDKREERWKMWMMRIMTRTFGGAILALDETWTIFINTKKFSVLHSTTSRPTAEHLGPFAAALMTHNLSNVNSAESKLTQEICTMISEWPMRKQTYETRTALLPPTINDFCSIIQTKRAHVFTQYVRQAVDLLFQDIAPEQMTSVQKHILEDPNKRSPFRECTSNRMRTKGPEGPFYGNRIRTNAGLFSAVVWRAITLHTRFEKEHAMVFRDFEHWKEEINGLNEVDICNPRAHSTPTKRKSALAEMYWNSVLKLGWEDYTAPNMRPTFADTYAMLYNGKSGHDSKRPFPQLGAIGALHLAADISYAKLHDQVTLNEIGEYMTNIDSGSSLGAAVLLAQQEEEDTTVGEKGKAKAKAKGKSKPKILATDCMEGVRRALELINQSLWDDEKAAVGPIDPILVEHTLCKFQIAWRKGVLSDIYAAV